MEASALLRGTWSMSDTFLLSEESISHASSNQNILKGLLLKLLQKKELIFCYNNDGIANQKNSE